MTHLIRYFTDPDLLGRVPNLLLILGGIYLGMGMLACLLISQPPDDWVLRHDPPMVFTQQ
jgi:hypothetical protein